MLSGIQYLFFLSQRVIIKGNSTSEYEYDIHQREIGLVRGKLESLKWVIDE